MENLQKEKLNHILMVMSVFYHTTDLPCILIDAEGNIVHREGQESLYCEKIKALSGPLHCKTAHKKARQQAETFGEAYISYCPAGLVQYTVALTSGRLFEGAIIAGPIHMSEPDDYEVDTTIRRLGILGKAKEDLSSLYHSVPIVSPKKAKYHLELLTILARDIIREHQGILDEKKAYFDEQRTINETIQEMKETLNLSETTSGAYLINREKALTSTIIKGDLTNARAILNELLGFIFLNYKGNNRRISVLTLELVVVMSRAAVEGGARQEDVLLVTEAILLNAHDIEDIEGVCLNLIKALDKIIALVFPMDTGKTEQINIMRKAIVYMNQHLHENIGLHDVSKAIGLSPTYFSRVFSQEMNMTFIDYLTRIKVEESKKYLADSKQSISDIALRLGFSDQSYFSKVFKKVEGMTPGKYRKMFL